MGALDRESGLINVHPFLCTAEPLFMTFETAHKWASSRKQSLYRNKLRLKPKKNIVRKGL